MSARQPTVGVVSRFDRISLLAITAVAALLRLPGIEARGRFDADQGTDMLALMRFTREGVWPLLGAKVSVGDLHQGAAYYYLLAPAAWISNADPVAVTVWVALLGIAAVLLTWWFARSIAGSLAGALAGLLLAISPAAIEGSTFIWNPNLIPAFSMLAIGAAWQAHASAATASPRRIAAWWALAIGSAGMVIQLHLLGIIFFAAIGALAALHLRGGRGGRGVAWGIVGGLGVAAVLFLPLLVHELQTGFEEVGRIADYLRTGGGDAAPGAGPVSALAFTLLRIVGWPLVGLVTDVPAVASVLLAVVAGLTAVGILRARGARRTAMWWLVGLLAWSTVALAFAAPSLQTVVPGLPNDHYHAFVGPIVILLVAVPVAGLFEAAMAAWRADPVPARAVAPALLGVGVVVLAVVMLGRKPAHVDPNGGWPAMQAAGQRVAAVVGGDPVSIRGLPDFKAPDAIRFPIEYAGVRVAQTTRDEPRVHEVIVCDRLFEPVMHQRCGGPAERILLGRPDDDLIDRFDASPRTVVSIYGPPPP